jgi:type II secretory pathway pseudopilin PulG
MNVWGRVTRVRGRRGGARATPQSGLTILELLFTIAIGATITVIALPLTGNAVDEIRTRMAARYMEGQIMRARMDALRRSRAVGLRFEPWEGDYLFAMYADGNGNGIRTADIALAIDMQLVAPDRLSDKYPGVRFELLPDIPEIDGDTGGTRDGLRIGTSRILTLTPDGSSSSGTLYVRGRRAQCAVRVLGVTGRTRVLQYSPGARAWIVR